MTNQIDRKPSRLRAQSSSIPYDWKISEPMIVNLNRFRKERRRAEEAAQAKENRVRFGRSKEERAKELRESERARQEIENKRLD
jgi:hypothetical protein